MKKLSVSLIKNEWKKGIKREKERTFQNFMMNSHSVSAKTKKQPIKTP